MPVAYLRFAAIALAMVVSLNGSQTVAADQAPAPHADEAELIKTLQKAAPPEQALACKQLAIHGTAKAVPHLAALLSDEQLASWARIALEAIPDEAADAALLSAAGELQGTLLVGVVNSLGVRRHAAAVGQLTTHLQSADPSVAASSAAALGRIANADASKTLRQALTDARSDVRSAVAEGCILCAERLMADGASAEAAALYDEIRKAELPQQRVLEATRGAILARGDDGIPLLLEQLRSPDKREFQIALSTARELPGDNVSERLAAQLQSIPPERAALLLSAITDRGESALPRAVLQTAAAGDGPVSLAAIAAIGQLGDVSHVATLLEIANDPDADRSQAAKAALKQLPGERIDAELKDRLQNADDQSLAALIEVIGERRIDAAESLVAALQHSDPQVRRAALLALGATVDPASLPVLIAAAVDPSRPDDAQVAVKALREAAVRMPDREKCAALLAAAMDEASPETDLDLLEVLANVGGAKALETIGAAANSDQPKLQDAGSRLLGQWMSVDAAPVLLEAATNPTNDKYRVRALRGYLRLVRQFSVPEDQRAEMCRKAIEAATRPDEQKLALEVLERYPTVYSLKVALKAAQQGSLKADATRAALAIVQQIGSEHPEVRQALADSDLKPVKVEIVKAQYGAGDSQRDVTAVLQQHVVDLPLITLASGNYNEVFQGDPAPGAPKQLKVEYRINGEPGSASFPENAAILLPMP